MSYRLVGEEFLTEVEFKNGIDIDIDNEVPNGSDTIDFAHDIGGGNFEGDMILTERQMRIINRNIHPRFGVASDIAQLWPRTGDSVNIPTSIRWNEFSNDEKVRISKAVLEYARCTCIRFIERTNETDYIRVHRERKCSSKVGKIGGAQDLSLAPGCARTVGTPIHEFMHALGFKHEHTRSDRDRFVEINFENIKKGHESNFKKCGYCNNQRLPYDTGSVMHYSSYSFSKNGKPTIIVKDGSGIGQRNGFSLSDLKGINDLYCSHLSYNRDIGASGASRSYKANPDNEKNNIEINVNININGTIGKYPASVTEPELCKTRPNVCRDLVFSPRCPITCA